MTLLFCLFAGTVLMLSGVGLGTVGATVIGMSKLADLQKQAGARAPGASGETRQPGQSARPGDTSGSPQAGGSKSASGGGSSAPGAEPAARATLGVEAVDAPKGGGALVVGVHLPGPGYTAGLVRGDVLTSCGSTPVGSAADLARAVAAADPGTAVTLGVRHTNGSQQQLSAIPGIVT